MFKIVLKWILGVLLFLVVIFAVWQRDLVAYGIMQGQGQFEILWNAQPIDEIIQNPNTPDSLRQRLQLTGKVRDWAVENLKLRETDNYTTLYNQKGKDVLWVLTASQPYATESKEWVFPVVGKVSYKGFFNYEKLEKEKALLEEEGWETYVRPVGAWSTLGWFKDPLMSNLLFRTEGDLINTIIHELTHATVFVKDSLDFNENLATFIGHQGTLNYLKEQQTDSSEAYKIYTGFYADRKIFSEHLLYGLRRLRTLYGRLPENMHPYMKEHRKQALIRQIGREIIDLPLTEPARWQAYYFNLKPNNAYFLSYERYRGEQQELNRQFEQDFSGNLVEFIAYYKNLYAKD